MTEIDRLKNELKNYCKGSDYSVSGNKKSGILYNVYSDSLRQSLRDIIHSGALNEEWQIGHTFGQNRIEYVMERDNNFAVYRKSLNDNSPDELAMLNTNQPQDASSQTWQRREKFLQSSRNIENSRKVVENSRRRNELRQQGGGFGVDNYVAYSSVKNERGERTIKKEEHYSDPDQEQATKEGYGYSLANEILAELSKEKGNVFSLPGTDRARIKDQSESPMETDESKPESSATSPQRGKKNLRELEEELSYLKSLLDEKGYLKKSIQNLEQEIANLKRQEGENFTQRHLIPPKK